MRGGVNALVVTVYLDALFALNTLINYLLLLAAARLIDCPFRRWRLWLGAALGGAYAVLIFLPAGRPAASWPGKALAALLMAAAALGGLPRRRFVRFVLVFWGVSFALGGCLLALQHVTGRGFLQNGVPVAPLNLPTLLLGAGACHLLLTLVFRRSARHGGASRDIVAVSVGWAGRETAFSALRDTGNTLSDPLSGTPVMVTELDRVRDVLPPAAALLIDNKALRRPEVLLTHLSALGLAGRFRLIPYRAVGVDCGFLLAFRPDVVRVGQARAGKLLVALSPTGLSAEGSYSAVVGQ
ncbi:MAG: sigma-E processing peptidase SpoIIGA [Oscillospiraceae bacterium]|jgi:stage II sporulation protein GA (sporulation sigma-E factor processing peptidase)|nr:sigma-E processing peptidase SpoIIGA [Oscillospiraceae bacterium]